MLASVNNGLCNVRVSVMLPNGDYFSNLQADICVLTVFLIKACWHTNCSGKGAVVGFLKTGSKKLFIYDRQGNQHEMEPLCILDFYVHESCQRQGSGKRLFEVMLRVSKR